MPALRRIALPAILSCVFTGCTIPTSSTHTARVASATGSVMGGQQPVKGSTIQLYTVGTAGDGSPAVPLLSTTVTTSDGSNTVNSNANAGNANNALPLGSFTITGDYLCPDPNALVYITASGGDSGAGTGNSALELLSALGTCGSLSASTQVTVNEISTIGSLAALYPYASAFNAIGSSSAHAGGIRAAFANTTQYFDLASGVSPGSNLPSGVQISSSQVNALADILSICVNSTGPLSAPCSSLFASVAPASAPSDTVTTALAIFNNPTYNAAGLFNLITGNAPFPTALTSPPITWTIPVMYTPSQPPDGTPFFLTAAGTYSSIQYVQIASSLAGATIYYTTDGSTPTTSSAVYAVPIPVASTTTIKAFAAEYAHANSGVATGIFTVDLAPPTVSLSPISSPIGQTAAVAVTASSSVNGSLVTAGNSLYGSFYFATCTISGGSCTLNFYPFGTAAVGTYANAITASFSAYGSYSSASASTSLTIGSLSPFNLLTSFLGTTGAVQGSAPLGGLIQASDGNLYGVTINGGANNLGVIFRLTPAGAYTLLHTFTNSATDGVHPTPGLIQGNDGNFYGVALQMAPQTGAGIVYQLTPSGTLTVLHAFNPATDGGFPTAALTLGTDGAFYGTTPSNGPNNYGTLFRVTSAGGFSVLYAFSSASGAAYPTSSVVQGSDGNFYGTAKGTSGTGAIYRVSPSGSFTLLHSLTSAEGTAPAGLTEGQDGNFYGASNGGGYLSPVYGNGTIIKITSAGVVTVLHSFGASKPDALESSSPLTLGSDGNFYGTTEGEVDISGNTHPGAVFQISPAGAFQLLHASQGLTTDASGLDGGLVQGADGRLFGLGNAGGTNNLGTAYQVTVGSGLPGPITLTVPSTVTHGSTFNLSYSVANAYSTTLATCFATNTAGDTTGWTGPRLGNPATATVSLSAPSTPGTYTYTLTCGGQESGFATLTVH